MRRSKVIRQRYQIEALHSSLGSKEPTHASLPTRWNSTHQMCDDAFCKRVVVDTIMDQYKDDIGHDALKDSEWQVISSKSNFLCAPRQVMESLAADCKPTLDLVSLYIAMLIKHCNDNEQNLQEIHDALTTISMKMKLQSYEKKLVQEPAIIAAYLNPQIPKPTNTAELMVVTKIVRNVLQQRYSDAISLTQSRELPSETSCNSLFFAMFQPKGVESGMGNEVDLYLLTDVVHASSFINVLSWRAVRSELVRTGEELPLLGTETDGVLIVGMELDERCNHTRMEQQWIAETLGYRGHSDTRKIRDWKKVLGQSADDDGDLTFDPESVRVTREEEREYVDLFKHSRTGKNGYCTVWYRD
ncbi:hypothetical protein AXG93_242s1410 [Marchantia polymorpha subsp. ruderalis]|uniref:Uncharacterized protein n=1 Tax=Marchantia polymorpha subsp. ruderalis TaxID=1480154 RepID=A0A176VMX2_MARPO|nr:hypothetical protein AXG93_242s1410 [Marchantia polymorpha subsp. ruderalis]